MEGQRALRFHQNDLNLCSEDEWMSYGFGTTWGWVINHRIFIFWWTIPLILAKILEINESEKWFLGDWQFFSIYFIWVNNNFFYNNKPGLASLSLSLIRMERTEWSKKFTLETVFTVYLASLMSSQWVTSAIPFSVCSCCLTAQETQLL